ncbi:MAG: hypothetical protein HY744_20215 [Deltaproteobacteria bacterium]|nr:hypothetical protein [Deltaproteobacteria bacterium]
MTGDSDTSITSAPASRRWRYEPDEKPKKKHHWDKPRPGFVKVRGVDVGKCPHGLSLDRAERLLNQGIAYDPPRAATGDWPSRIYVVYEGAVFRAVPTNPGVSYHAFPDKPAELSRLPRHVLEQIEERARELGCEQEVKRWIRG